MRLKFTTILATATLSALLLTGCSVNSTTGGTKPSEQKGGIFGLSTKSDLEVQTTEAFKGQNQVVIGGFKVGFIESKKDSAKAGSGFGGKSSAKLQLNNIDAATQQQIANTAYADFVSKLKAAGYKVMDRGNLINSPDFKGANSEPSPHREEASLFGSKTTIAYVAPQEINRIYWTGESGNMGGMGFGNPSVAAATYAGKSKVPVLFVNYIIDFANAQGSGGRWSATSSLNVGQGISVAPGGGVSIFGGQGGTFQKTNGGIKFGQAVSSDETYGEIVKTSTDAGVALETAANAFTAVLGGGTSQTRSFEISADPAKYKAVSGNVLAESNSRVVSKMKELR